MLTNKKCSKCGGKLDFNEDAKGRELTCKKCGAVFEYRTYMKALATRGSVIPESVKNIIKEARRMPKEKVCKVCGKGKEAGRIWGGMHKACRKNKKTSPPAGAIQTGIAGPDGVVIPVRLEITVSVKVEAK